MGWLFRRPSGPAPRGQDLLRRLDELAIGDVLLAPDDPRGAVLASYGLRERDTNANTTVWSR